MLQKCSILDVAGVFFNEPTKQHYLIEVSKKSKIAHTSVKKHLAKLKKLSIISETVEIRGTRKFPLFKADINSSNYRVYKNIYNLIKIKQSGLIEFLKSSLMPNCIVLFGSYQKGEDLENSDIDIFVEAKPTNLDLSVYKKRLHRNIQLIFKDNFKKYPKELKNNIINGIILDGFLEAF